MLEALLQFVLKLCPEFLRKIWYKNESLWRYCYYGAWTTVVSMITRFAGLFIFERAGMPIDQSALASGINTTVSQIITITFAFYVNKKYVFHSESKEKSNLIHEILTFYGARGASFFLDLGLNELPVLFGWGKKGVIIMFLLSQIIILAANYLFSKLVVFKKGAEETAADQAAQNMNGTAEK